MNSAKMTRIGSAVLKFSILILFSMNAAADGNDGPFPRVKKKAPKLDPNASCQMEMFLPEAELTAPPEDAPLPSIEDLTLMQGEMFDFFAKGDYKNGEGLRNRLESQLLMTRLPKTPHAYGNSHELFKVSNVSWLVLRAQPAGGKETSAYETVKALGYPIQMPVTVAYGPNAGSLQIYHGYADIPSPRTVISPSWADPRAQAEMPGQLKREPMNGELRREIQHEIANDPDMFLVDFITLNKGRYAENVVYLRNHKRPLVPYDWDDGFMCGPLANFEFFELAQSWYGVPALQPDKRNNKEYYQSAKAILREAVSRSKFDWKKALMNISEENLIENLKLRLQDNQAALQVRGQICALRAAIFDGDLRICQKYGFNLTRGYTGPGYRQHDR